MKLCTIAAVGCTILCGCASNMERECKLPPLAPEDVTAIAKRYLAGKNMNPTFEMTAQKRVRETGCRYVYEEAERLDSFGVGIAVVVTRDRKVVDFSGTN